MRRALKARHHKMGHRSKKNRKPEWGSPTRVYKRKKRKLKIKEKENGIYPKGI